MEKAVPQLCYKRVFSHSLDPKPTLALLVTAPALPESMVKRERWSASRSFNCCHKRPLPELGQCLSDFIEKVWVKHIDPTSRAFFVEGRYPERLPQTASERMGTRQQLYALAIAQAQPPVNQHPARDQPLHKRSLELGERREVEPLLQRRPQRVQPQKFAVTIEMSDIGGQERCRRVVDQQWLRGSKRFLD